LPRETDISGVDHRNRERATLKSAFAMHARYIDAEIPFLSLFPSLSEFRHDETTLLQIGVLLAESQKWNFGIPPGAPLTCMLVKKRARRLFVKEKNRLGSRMLSAKNFLTRVLSARDYV